MRHMATKPAARERRRAFHRQLPLQAFVLIGLAYLFVFSYIPMFGLIIGFKDYDIVTGIPGMFTSPWVGLKYFREFFSDPILPELVRNTFMISILKLIFTFPAPIIFAIMLNELRGSAFKKLVQTSSYLPHFISWVIVSGIVYHFFSSNGIVNNVLMALHVIDKPIGYLNDPDLFWGFAVISDIWKEMGWWTIIFLAAIVGVNQDLYESAQIDGAGRLKRIWYITLPSIAPTIAVVLIMALGNLLGGGLSGSSFEQSYLFGNAMNSSHSQIIQTYTFKVGLSQGRYAYATAVGLLQSVISLVLVFGSNYASKKVSGASLF